MPETNFTVPSEDFGELAAETQYQCNLCGGISAQDNYPGWNDGCPSEWGYVFQCDSCARRFVSLDDPYDGHTPRCPICNRFASDVADAPRCALCHEGEIVAVSVVACPHPTCITRLPVEELTGHFFREHGQREIRARRRHNPGYAGLHDVVGLLICPDCDVAWNPHDYTLPDGMCPAGHQPEKEFQFLAAKLCRNCGLLVDFLEMDEHAIYDDTGEDPRNAPGEENLIIANPVIAFGVCPVCMVRVTWDGWGFHQRTAAHQYARIGKHE